MKEKQQDAQSSYFWVAMLWVDFIFSVIFYDVFLSTVKTNVTLEQGNTETFQTPVGARVYPLRIWRSGGEAGGNLVGPPGRRGNE